MTFKIKSMGQAVMVAVVLWATPLLAQAGSTDSAQLEEGKVLFQTDATPACAICHTLKDADATGTIGPNMDQLNLSLDGIKQVMLEGMGVMPSFADSLTNEQRDAIAQYIIHATRSN